MKTNRRDFILGSLSGGLALPFARMPLLRAAQGQDKTIVILQLRGGNDSTNTVAPAENTIYQAARPTLRVNPTATLAIGRDPVVGNLYFHPAMQLFKQMFDAGRLAVITGVGYPNHNLSHFGSEDVWYSADPTVTNGVTAGWLGNFFRGAYQGGFVLPAVVMSGELNKSFTGYSVPSVKDVDQFTVKTDPFRIGFDDLLLEQVMVQNAFEPHVVATPNPNLVFVANGIDKAVSASKLVRRAGAGYAPKVTYPANNELSDPFKLIARYITGGSTTPGQGLQTSCYYLLTGGFDTHANQAATHQQLLQRVSSAVDAFLKDLTAWGADDNVIVFIWTEFARRFGENGSRGTDHGKAGVLFVAGKGVKGGLYGGYPDINQLRPPYENAHTEPTTDFRDVYSALLNKWWGVDPTKVIPRHTPNYARLGFLV